MSDSKSGRFDRPTVVLGVLVIAMMVAFEARAILRTPGGVEGSRRFTALESAAEASGIGDRLQVLIAHFDPAGLAAPTGLWEWIIPKRELDRGAPIEKRIDLGLRDFTLTLTWHADESPGPRFLDPLQVKAFLDEMPLGEAMHQSFGVNGKTLDVGDGRPFFDAGVTIASAPLFGILSRPQPRFEVVARWLHEGDVLTELGVTEAARRLGASARAEVPYVFLPGRVEESPAEPLLRLLRDANGFGLLLLVNGLLLVVYHRQSLVRGTVLLAVVALLMVSVSARLDAWVQRGRLADGGADARVEATLRLAHGTAFLPSSAGAIRAAFEREEEPDVKAGLLLAAVHDGEPILAHGDVGAMIAAAAEHPSGGLRRAAELARQVRGD